MYNTKTEDYFTNIRLPLLELIPIANRNGTILEIGAASGDNLIYAKNNGYAKKIYDIELTNIENSNQQNCEFEKFIIADIEKLNLDFKDEFFDVILIGDVLEHLVDPYTILKKLQRILAPNGVVIASIPNIREWKTMKKIFFQGDFKYEESGILDRTHLRFFTKKNIIELFENQNYKIKSIVSSNGQQALKYLLRLRLFKFFLQIFFNEFVTLQYYVVAEKHK